MEYRRRKYILRTALPHLWDGRYEEHDDILCIITHLLLTKTTVARTNKCQAYPLQRYITVRTSMNKVNETVGYVCPRSSTGSEVDYSLTHGTGTFREWGLTVRALCDLERSQTLQFCVDMLRSYHAVGLLQKHLCPLRRFCPDSVRNISK